jgi:type III restriction enzyme
VRGSFRRSGILYALSTDERKRGTWGPERNEAAALWLTGLEAVHAKLGVRAVYDLSATPFYLRGSGYPEGTLFLWVVSDFALIDAIESGIVKFPRVPVADISMSGDLPTFRDLWTRIREGLPKKGRSSEQGGSPNLPRDLEAALLALYAHYEQSYREWEAEPEGLTPPVFIVVCNNTTISKMVFDWIGGYATDKLHHDGTPFGAGRRRNAAGDTVFVPASIQFLRKRARKTMCEQSRCQLAP